MSHSQQPDVLEVVEFHPDEVIRVLQVRPRARMQLPTPTPAAQAAPAETVTPVFRAAPPAPVPPAPPLRLAAVPSPPAKAAPAARVPVTKKRERSLEETLDDLQTYVVSLADEDPHSTSTTGVRHLHVELEKPTKKR